MSTSTVEIEPPFAEDVTSTDQTLSAELSDGRTIAVPLGWHPRLVHAATRPTHLKDDPEELCTKCHD